MSEQEQDFVEVVVRLPVHLVLNGDPEELRKMLGENVYRRALVKIEPTDDPLEADLG